MPRINSGNTASPVIMIAEKRNVSTTMRQPELEIKL